MPIHPKDVLQLNNIIHLICTPTINLTHNNGPKDDFEHITLAIHIIITHNFNTMHRNKT